MINFYGEEVCTAVKDDEEEVEENMKSLKKNSSTTSINASTPLSITTPISPRSNASTKVVSPTTVLFPITPSTGRPNPVNYYAGMDETMNAPIYNPNFETHAIKIPFRMLIVGKSGSMKTNTLKFIVDTMKGTFKKIFVVTANANEPLYNLMQQEEPDLIQISEGMDTVPALDSFSPEAGVNYLIVFDDMLTSPNLKPVSDYYIRCRKMNMSAVFISQSYYFENKEYKIMRKQCDYIVIKQVQGERDLKMIIKEYSIDLVWEKFNRLYLTITYKNPADFLMVDLNEMPHRRLRHNLETIDMGSPEFNNFEAIAKPQPLSADGKRLYKGVRIYENIMEDNDLYETPKKVVDDLIECLFSFVKEDERCRYTIYDASCGNNKIVDAFKFQGFNAIGTDLTKGQNFLVDFILPPCNVIVMNPPFNASTKFLVKCYDISAQVGIPFAFLLPFENACRIAKQRLFFQMGIFIYLIHPTPRFLRNGKDVEVGCVAWFVYHPEFNVPGQVVLRQMTDKIDFCQGVLELDSTVYYNPELYVNVDGVDGDEVDVEVDEEVDGEVSLQDDPTGELAEANAI